MTASAARAGREHIGSEAVCNGTRLLTAIARARARRPVAWPRCCYLLVTMRTGPVWRRIADEAYSATVKVDATAENAAAAREAARLDGQRRALADGDRAACGLARSAKPPKLDDKAITDMVESFEVGNERMSAVRYVADFTFHFRPSKVRRLSGSIALPPRAAPRAPAETGGKASGREQQRIDRRSAGISRMARPSSSGMTLMRGAPPGRSGRRQSGPRRLDPAARRRRRSGGNRCGKGAIRQSPRR